MANHGKPNNDNIKKRLETLGQNLDTARGNQKSGYQKEQPGGGSANNSAAIGKALRMATEMVVAAGVGAFIGWALDKWFETAPVWMLIFFAVGVVAGILNVIRAAQRMQAEQAQAGVPIGEDLPAHEQDDE